MEQTKNKKEELIDYKLESTNKIKKLLRCRYVYITKSCDHAIDISFKVLRKNKYPSIVIQDQGGWMNYEKIAEQNNLGIKKIKTNFGLLEKEEVTKKIGALIIAEPAGYFATQKLVHGIRKHTDFLILDICGSIGKSYIKMFKPDIFVCSFKKWKPINIGKGGFIATNDEDIDKLIVANFEQTEFDEEFYKTLYEKLIFLGMRYDFFDKICRKIKTDLKDYEILHRDDEGINVIVRYKDDLEKNEIIDYCTKNNYPFEECPRYIRVMEKAISIEVKRL